MNDPIDDTHRACIAARIEIRVAFLDARFAVHRWQPRPMPDGWGRR